MLTHSNQLHHEWLTRMHSGVRISIEIPSTEAAKQPEKNFVNY